MRVSSEVCVLLLTISVCATTAVIASESNDPDYSVFPWPYGIVVMSLEAKLDVDLLVSRLVDTVEDVCELWALPIPPPPEDWRDVLDRNVCEDMLEGTFVRQRIAAIGRTWWQCPIVWGDDALSPVAVVVFAEFERLGDLNSRWTTSARYGSVSIEEGPGASVAPAVAMAERDLASDRGLLAHELTHWLQSWCTGLQGLPLALREGMAVWTEERIRGTRSYEPIAAAFARTEGLAKLPRSLVYPVGASFAEFLWRRLGGLLYRRLAEADLDCDRLSRVCGGWNDLVWDYAGDWKRSLEQVDLSEADWVHYMAARQSLGAVRAMLSPVLDSTGERLLTTIWSTEATQADLAAFWEFAESAPAEPSAEVWAALAARERAFIDVAVENAQYVAPPAPAELLYDVRGLPDPGCVYDLILELAVLRDAGDWPRYYARYLELIREIIVEASVYDEIIPWWSPESDGS